MSFQTYNPSISYDPRHPRSPTPRKKHELEVTFDDLEMENSILKQQLSALKDLNGKNLTDEILKLSERLKRYKRENESLKAQLEEAKKHQHEITICTTSIDSKAADATLTSHGTSHRHTSLFNEAVNDSDALKLGYDGFQDGCQKMFHQLQSTAAFMERLIRSLQDSENLESQKWLSMIRELHLDLNSVVKFDKGQDEMDRASLETQIQGLLALTKDLKATVTKLTTQIEELTESNTSLTDTVQVYQANEIKYKQEIAKLKNVTNEIHSTVSGIPVAASQKHVPQILNEMSDIHKCLTSTASQFKELSKLSKISKKK